MATDGGKRCFASDLPHDEPGRDLCWAESGYGIETKWWKKHKGSYPKLYKQLFAEHRAQKQKDGLAFFPGELSGDRCVAANVAHIDLVIADVDATDLQEIAAVVGAIEAAGIGCDIYSTYNHGVPYTEIKFDLYEAFCRNHGLEASSPKAARRYLLEVEGYRSDVANDAFVKEQCAQSQEGLGTVVVLGQAPVIKLRLVFTLDRPYSPVEMVKLGFSNDDARGRLWVAIQRALFSALGIPFDGSTTDVARRFYAAARRVDAKTVSVVRIPGRAVRLDAILPTTVAELDTLIPPKGSQKKKTDRTHAKQPPQSSAQNDNEDLTFQGFNFKAWAKQYAKTFKSEELFAARGLVLAARDAGGCFVQCYQEDQHTSPNPPRTFTVSAASRRSAESAPPGTIQDRL